MDNLVLVRVADALDGALRGSVLREFRQEGHHRFRLRFEGPGQTRGLVVSLRPEMPWVGRPAERRPGGPGRPAPFAGEAERVLRGKPVAGVAKPGADRQLVLRLADGVALVLELATHGANIVLVDADGRVVAAARRPASAIERLRVGVAYQGRPLPPRCLNPFAATPAEIDRFVEDHVAGGETVFEALRRHVFGIGTEGARLVLAEHAAGAASVGGVLHARLQDLVGGREEPCILAAEDPLVAANAGRLAPERFRLLPWAPPEAAEPSGPCLRRGDAAATAGLYYESFERAARLGERATALRALLADRAARLAGTADKVDEDLDALDDPDRLRRFGEALLAGSSVARRDGDAVLVPDPYSVDGALLRIPAKPGDSLHACAQRYFDRHRRARRGIDQARRRLAELRAARGTLEELRARYVDAVDVASLDQLEQAMQSAGIPVALGPPTRRARARAALARPRLEGVRVVTSPDGLTILVGKGGRDNHRLTFRIAGPDDFWFHALGRSGAHVVVRNPDRVARPPQGTLEQAAALAAWYSEGRQEAAVDVQWTRRKYVRRARGGPAGAVLLKRFDTVRVRPRSAKSGRVVDK